MNAQSIIQDIKSGKFSPVYLLHGEESFDIDLIADTIAENVLSEAEQAFNQHIFYGKETEPIHVIDFARQYPMMAPFKVIIVKEAQEMRNLTFLEKYLKNPSPSTILVICHKHKKLDGRTTFFKTAKKSALIFESKKLYDSQLPGWIENFVHEHKYQIHPVATAVIIEYLGNDLSKIANELNKLVLNLQDEKEIKEQHVFDHIGISKEYNVFELQKALGQRDHFKVMQIIKYFGENPKQNPIVLLISNLYNYFTKIYLTKTLARSNDRDIAQALGLKSTYFVKEYRLAAKQFQTAEVEKILEILRAYDLRSKGVDNRSVSPDQLMREMIQKILFCGSVPVTQ